MNNSLEREQIEKEIAEIQKQHDQQNFALQVKLAEKNKKKNELKALQKSAERDAERLQLQKKERQTIQDAINSNLQGLKTEKTGLHCSYCISESSSYGTRLLIQMHKVIKNKELKQSRDMGALQPNDLYCPFCKRVIKHYLIFSS